MERKIKRYSIEITNERNGNDECVVSQASWNGWYKDFFEYWEREMNLPTHIFYWQWEDES